MKTFNIGKFKIEQPIIPAPMCGIMDYPFREMICKFGAPFVYTEMLSSDAMNLDYKKEYIKNSSKKNFSNNIPFVIQIAGHDPNLMSNAAKICQDLGADIIDMNFGCPVKKVVNGHAGSALMKDLKKSTEIIKATVQSVKIPVTIKMRLGWDFDLINAPELAKIAEDLGCKTITVHGRTRSQLYEGNANWKLIKDVKNAVKIPVIANGDITNIEKVNLALEESSADGVMIARELYGKPWLIQEMRDFFKTGIYKNLKPKNILQEIIEPHIILLEEHYKEKCLGFIVKHLYFYSKGIENGGEFRSKISKLKKIEDILEISSDFFQIAKTLPKSVDF